jgi:hypothetical protein
MVTAMVVKDIIYGQRVSARKADIGAVRKLSGGPCQNNFRGCDGLAYMTLGMIGDMYQQPCNRRGQLLPSHDPDLFEYAHVEGPHSRHTIRQGGTQL